MKEYNGDLLRAESWDAMCHVANNYCVFGSGIAAQILNVFPMMYDADKETNDICEWPERKLGTFSMAQLDGYRYGYNLYAMNGLGNTGGPLSRNLSYDHLFDAMLKMVEDVITHSPIDSLIRIGLPKLMGCDRAGGSWLIVLGIIADLEYRYPRVEFLVYNFN